MAYNQTTLDGLSSQIAELLGDPTEKFWTRQEKYYAIWEALRIFGAYTSYWRERGVITVTPTSGPFYDLSDLLPNLRSRTWTLGRMVDDIRFMLMEPGNALTGVGMTGQIPNQAIIDAIKRARNRFVIDARIPYSYQAFLVSPPPLAGMVTLAEEIVYLHRTAWKDEYSGQWTNLWRQDAWSIDKSNPDWTLYPSSPREYSESESAPLKIQLSPEPVNIGYLDSLAVQTLQIPTEESATFDIPDEWIFALKYSALADILTTENQAKDATRAQYADMRYRQAIEFTRSATSITRILRNNVPLPIDSLASLDAAYPFWRNQAGTASLAGVAYDVFALSRQPEGVLGLSVDVVRSAPLPAPGNGNDAYLQIGRENLDTIVNYVLHILNFKCGGNEFIQSMLSHDAFMKDVETRVGANVAKITYLAPLFQQNQVEQGNRPDNKS